MLPVILDVVSCRLTCTQTFRDTNDDDNKQHNKQAMVIIVAELPAVVLSSTARWVVVVPAFATKVWVIINSL